MTTTEIKAALRTIRKLAAERSLAVTTSRSRGGVPPILTVGGTVYSIEDALAALTAV